jgi:hypothetical protein
LVRLFAFEHTEAAILIRADPGAGATAFWDGARQRFGVVRPLGSAEGPFRAAPVRAVLLMR